jgi:hypothetical protein
MNFQKNDYTGENNPNYGNKKLSEKYKQNPEMGLEKQSRKGNKNGRCVPVVMEFQDGTIREFDYIRECAKFILENNLSRMKTLECISKEISDCVSGKKDYFSDFYFYKKQ